jgi:hypothetical protein
MRGFRTDWFAAGSSISHPVHNSRLAGGILEV